MNVKIAEHLGWTQIEAMENRRPWGYPPIPYSPPQRVFVPNYTRDLNAMAEARRTLSMAESCRFWEVLHAIVKSRCVPNIDDASIWCLAIDAPCEERAEAFLIVKGYQPHP